MIRKKHDPEIGKLSSFELCNPDDYQRGLIAVANDLCDGGGTFTSITSAFCAVMGDGIDLSIFVIHMINLKGAKTLSEHYSKILFSDSYKYESAENLPETSCFRKPDCNEEIPLKMLGVAQTELSL